MRAWALPLVFGIAVVVLGATALALQAAGRTRPPSGAPAQAGALAQATRRSELYACAALPDAPDFCQYLGQQMARRNQLGGADYRSAAGAGLDIRRVVRAALPMPHARCVPTTPTGPDPPCRVVRDPGEPSDPQHVEQALLAAGYRGAVVRLAGSGDPAPPGALLYAVPSGDACVIGYENPQTGTGSQGVVGTLPGQTCLSP